MEPAPPISTRPEAADEAATLIAADRWWLWHSLVRGLSHQLANASQMLALDPVPAGALLEARERLGQAMSALGALKSSPSEGPTLLPSVLADLDGLHRMQMDFPVTTLPMKLDPALPALAARPEDLIHLLLGMVTLLKQGAGEHRAELALTARASASGAEVEIEERTATMPVRWTAPLLALATELGARVESDPAGATLRLWLPAFSREAAGRLRASAASPASSDRQR